MKLEMLNDLETVTSQFDAEDLMKMVVLKLATDARLKKDGAVEELVLIAQKVFVALELSAKALSISEGLANGELVISKKGASK